MAYLSAIGTDLRNNNDESDAKIEKNDKNDEIILNPSDDSIPSIKFFILSNFEIGESNQSNEFGNLKLENIYYLMYKKDKKTDLYKGDNLNEINEFYSPIKEISYFSVSLFMIAAAFSFKNHLMEIQFSSNNKKDKVKVLLVKSPDKKNITNIKYCINNQETFLFFTTNETICYKKLGEIKFINVGSELIHSGANTKNFDINSNGNILISTPEHYIEEFFFDILTNVYENSVTKVFDRRIKFIQYIGKYYLFSLYEDNKPILCVYEPNNNIFVSYDDDFRQKTFYL